MKKRRHQIILFLFLVGMVGCGSEPPIDATGAGPEVSGAEEGAGAPPRAYWTLDNPCKDKSCPRHFDPETEEDRRYSLPQAIYGRKR